MANLRRIRIVIPQHERRLRALLTAGRLGRSGCCALPGNGIARPSGLLSIADAGSTAGVWVGVAMLAGGARSGLALTATVASAALVTGLSWTALVTCVTWTTGLSGAATVASLSSTALVSRLP